MINLLYELISYIYIYSKHSTKNIYHSNLLIPN
jgi:hypothetical protein